MSCEIEDIGKKFDSCRKATKYSMLTCCALVPISIVCVVVGHIPLLAVLAGHGCLSALGGTSYQSYKSRKCEKTQFREGYQSIDPGRPLQKLSCKISHDDVIRNILVNPELHNRYNHCINYISRETKNLDKIQSIRVAIDQFSASIHTFYHIHNSLFSV